MNAFDIYSTPAPAPPVPKLVPVSECGGTAGQEGKGVIAPMIILTDGRSFYVTANKEKLTELVDAGEVVFSEQELLRLKAACAECDHDGAASLASDTLEVKRVFSCAPIKRGEKRVYAAGCATPETHKF